jgi:hypothetical protein
MLGTHPVWLLVHIQSWAIPPDELGLQEITPAQAQRHIDKQVGKPGHIGVHVLGIGEPRHHGMAYMLVQPCVPVGCHPKVLIGVDSTTYGIGASLLRSQPQLQKPLKTQQEDTRVAANRTSMDQTQV